MSSTYWNTDWSRIACELQSRSYVELLEVLKAEGAIPAQTVGWSEVIGSQSAQAPVPPPSDEILLPILIHHHADRDLRWRNLVLAALWPHLRAIHGYRRRWDRDDAERWSNVLWCFHEAVCGFDPTERSSNLARVLLQRISHRLYEHYAREWKRHRREVRVDGRLLGSPSAYDGSAEGEGSPPIILAQSDPGFDEVELRERQQQRLARLQAFLDTGTLNLRDFLLLRATRVHGMRLADYCRDVGLDLAVGIKRRTRAEARMAAADLKNLKRRELFLSRGDRSRGL